MLTPEVMVAARGAIENVGGESGKACMRTSCQHVLPQCLRSKCRAVKDGRRAKKTCRPILDNCHADVAGRASCLASCREVYKGAQVKQCELECNTARCKKYAPYDSCLAAQSFKDVIRCFDQNCQGIVASCLKTRCGVNLQGN